jgi:hypothetical protein
MPSANTPWKDDREHITLAEQYSAAGRTLTAHLSSRHPSIYRTYIDTTQASDLSFREKLFVTGVFREHIHLSPATHSLIAFDRQQPWGA